MVITHISIGSKFKIDGLEYELVKVSGDGWQWMGADGFYKLGQPFYFDGTPTVAQVETMKKHLFV